VSVSDRTEKMARVAASRLRWVRCAVEHTWHRHNASALLRTADAFGVLDVHLVGAGRFQPSAGPASGAARWLRLHHHEAPEEAIAALRAAGVALWVADLASPPVAPEALPLDRPVCLWFGAELMGVSEAARAAADGVVTLPMMGMCQSLNLSVAAAAALYVVAGRARAERGEEALLPPAEREALLRGWAGPHSTAYSTGIPRG
jgi:tRNA (guanosine-2'-O-)-methyltransferase